MQAFGVLGPGATALADRLVGALEGRVGLVRTDGGVERPTGAADTVYRLADDRYSATGTGDLGDALDALAPDHDYAVVVDRPDADLPQVRLGDADHERAFHAASGTEAVDLAALVAAIDDLEPYHTLESLVAAVKRDPAADRGGAIATFTGRVRARDAPDDERTEYLEFETYEDVADDRLRALEADLADRDGVFAVATHHRTGVVPAGEDIVFVVVLAGHREAAFATVSDGIDRLKAEVPIFKKEVTEAETFWVHEREE